MKTERFNMVLTADQMEAYKAAARKEGLSLSQWVRRTLDGRAKVLGGKKHESIQEQMKRIIG